MNRFRFHLLAIGLVARFALGAAAQEEGKSGRFLYMGSPDGAQQEGRSGAGILVFSIDDGHRFVRRIDLPVFEQGLRGMTGSAVTGCLYYSTSAQTLGCFDIATEKVLWQSTFDRGCDRSSISADGKVIYVPTGWWYRGDDSGFLVVDAETGELRDRIAVGLAAHNSIATLDGRFIFLGTETKLTQFDAASGDVVKSIEPVGESGVFPFTVDSRNRFAYVCLGKHVGFDVVDLVAGRAVHRVLATGDDGAEIGHRTHGAGMLPDESELWISDQSGERLFVFDLDQHPPTQVAQLELSMGGHGWITFSRKGDYAWCHTPDVFDPRTRMKVATLKDGAGDPFASSKFLEVELRDGAVVAMGNEFGLGRGQDADLDAGAGTR